MSQRFDDLLGKVAVGTVALFGVAALLAAPYAEGHHVAGAAVLPAVAPSTELTWSLAVGAVAILAVVAVGAYVAAR